MRQRDCMKKISKTFEIIQFTIWKNSTGNWKNRLAYSWRKIPDSEFLR